MKYAKQSGFTLLEMVIAIGIFALMSAMAYGGLNSAINTREHTDVQAERLAQLQKTLLIIGRDIEQAIERPVRDNYGDELAPISGGGFGSEILELTRIGRANPMSLPRSHMQRVGYELQEGQLLKKIWPTLDQAIGSEPFEVIMLEDIKAVDLRFMDEEHEWQTQWPQPDLGGQVPPAMPRAVEVTIDLEDWGRVRRVFEVPQGFNTPT